MPVEETKALELFNADEKRIFPISNGTKWFILPFLKNQYGELNPENRVHASVIKTLKGENVESFKGLVSTLQGAKDKDKDKDKDKGDTRLSDIFNCWNEQKIVIHRSFTNQMKGKINSRLKDYSAEEICGVIKVYSEILKSPQFYFSYKWTLVDFFSRGFDKFADQDAARANYRIARKGVKPQEPINPSFKKARVEMKPEEE